MGAFSVPNFAGSGSGGGNDIALRYGGGSNQFANFPSMLPSGYPNNSGGYNPTSYTPMMPFGGSSTMVSGGPGTYTPGAPGTVPGSPVPWPSPSGWDSYSSGGSNLGTNLTGGPGAVGANDKLAGNAYTGPATDPLFTQDWSSYLRSQLGAGIQPYGLSAYLPSSGGYTSPGQVAAPLTGSLEQLQQFLQTGQGGGAGTGPLGNLAESGFNPTLAGLASSGGITGPLASLYNNPFQGALGQLGQTGGLSGPLASLYQGGGLPPELQSLLQSGGLTGPLAQLYQGGGLTPTLQQMAQTGNPINTLPAWQAMNQAQQTNIQQNQADLGEQFARMGLTGSTPAANAQALYSSQTAADQNSLLAQLAIPAQENAQQRMLQAGSLGIGTTTGLGQFGVQTQTGLGEFGTGLQAGLGQFGAQLQDQIGQFGEGLQTSIGQGGAGTELSAGTSALGAQLPAATSLVGDTSGLGQFLQGLDQQSIQTLMQQYYQSLPQSNPLLGYENQLASTYAPIYGKQGFGASFGSALGSTLGQGIGGAASGGISGGAGALLGVLGL